MKSVIPRLATALLLVATVAGVACSSSNSADANKAVDTAKTSATQVQQNARDAWANLRSDSDRLIDQVQTRNAPDAKQQLLDRCRNTQDQFRKNNDATNADRVGQLCDRIRNADPNAQGAWNEIKTQIKQLDDQFRS